MVWLKRLLLLGGALLVLAAIVYAFLPQPVRVDVEKVQRGHMEVAVRDDGMTRIRERYVVSTPIAGRLRRIEFDVGDEVIAGKTVVATMEPTAPNLLDPRELAQTQARVKAAEGRLKRVETDLQQAKDRVEQAKIDWERYKELSRQGATTQSQLEDAELTYRTLVEALKGAEFAKEIAEYELEQERAALLHVSGEMEQTDSNVEFEITSPITGRVLRLMQESSAVLAAGAPLMELGDPTDLEVVVDVLSSDAVRIQPGQTTLFEHWGGSEPLWGVVRHVEPSGFTKISALGVEEQRVNVIFDFTESLGRLRTLGDGYRVEARVIVWEEDDALMVPTGALFRSGEDWAVFVVKDHRAELRKIKVGENNGLQAQVLEGLVEGEQVIIHPSDEVAQGVKVIPRGS